MGRFAAHFKDRSGDGRAVSCWIYICAFLSSELGQAQLRAHPKLNAQTTGCKALDRLQYLVGMDSIIFGWPLTSRIYGAVVDEITEEQAQSVLIPVPSTDEEKKIVAQIDADAQASVLLKDRAVGLSQKAVGEMASLIPELGEREPDDVEDVEIARLRLAELEVSPGGTIKGSQLEEKMRVWQS